MGMAASQARFLTLTGRKSNVEYQGQQVNQERLQLANESANIFTQLSQLEVPTPPRVQDFNKTEYSFTTSEVDGTQRTYTSNDIQSTPSGDQVSLSWEEPNYQASVDDWVKSSSATISPKGTNDKNLSSGSYISFNGNSYQILSQQVNKDLGMYEMLAANNKDFADSIKGEDGSIDQNAYVYYYLKDGEKHVLQLKDEDRTKLAVFDFLSKLGGALNSTDTKINSQITLSALDGDQIKCTPTAKNDTDAAQKGYERSVYVTVPTYADREDFLNIYQKNARNLQALKSD